MKKWIPLTFLVVLSGLLRLYQIGLIPHGYTWDETSIIYNAWGLALWHRDEWANLLPLAFRSFGDYKAPLMFYLLAIPYKLFGVVPSLIRIYSALFGVITVICTYLIADHLHRDNRRLAFVSGLLVAISPWAINFSRVGFEANLGLGLVVLAVYLFLVGLTNHKLQLVSMLFFAASLYAYHSTKIAVPLILLLLAYLYREAIFHNRLKAITSGLVFFILLLPLVYVTFFGKGLERGMTLVFFDNNHKLQTMGAITQEIINNFQKQFSLDFLVGGLDAVGLRHLTPGYGILYLIEMPFLVFSLWLLIRRRDKILVFVWGFIVIGMLPAILSHQTPHAVRSLLMIPALQIAVAYGYLKWSEGIHLKVSPARNFLILLPGILLFINFCFYLNTYYGEYRKASAVEFQYGYKEALEIAADLGRTRDKIIVTDKYGQPYVYVLLHNRISPEQFLSGALANYEFHSISWPSNQSNRVFVATPSEIPPTDPAVQAVVKIPGTDKTIFVIATTPK